MAKNSLALSDRVVGLLAAADVRNGLPAGTMFSVMQQEIGGQSKFMADPTLPHYPTGVAPNGKRSSAFGPFGILESTGRDPGYGVAPLKDKSLDEQIRFASDYLAGRTRAAGGDLSKGLAGYGEGVKYANQVTARVGGGRGFVNPDPVALQPAVAAAPTPIPMIPNAPVQVAAPVARPEIPAAVDPQVVAQAAPVEDPWNNLQREVGAAMAERFKPTDMQYGAAPTKAVVPSAPMGPVDYQELLASNVSTQPTFNTFQGLSRLGRRPA